MRGETMLKPCPFCGGDPTFDRETTREVNTFFDSTYIRCTKCGVRTRGNIDKGRSKAINEWNRRVDVIPAVRDNMMDVFIEEKEGKTEGGYEWKRKDGKKILLLVKVVDDDENA